MTTTKLLATLGVDLQDPVMGEGRFIHLMEIHLPRGLELATSKPGVGNEGALLVIVNNVLELLHQSRIPENQQKVLQFLIAQLRRRAASNPGLQPILRHVQGVAVRFAEPPRKSPGLALLDTGQPAAPLEAASPKSRRGTAPDMTGTQAGGGLLMMGLTVTAPELQAQQKEIILRMRRMPADTSAKSLFHSIQQMFDALQGAQSSERKGAASFVEEKKRMLLSLVHDVRTLVGALLANALARDWLELFLKSREVSYIRTYDPRELPSLLPQEAEFAAEVLKRLEGKGCSMVRQGEHLFVVAPPAVAGDGALYALERIFAGDAIPIPLGMLTEKQKAVIKEMARRLITLAPLEGKPGRLLNVISDYLYEIKRDLLYSDLVNIDAENPFDHLDPARGEQLAKQLGGKLSGLPFRMKSMVFNKVENLSQEVRQLPNENDHQAAAQRVKLLVETRIPETLQDVQGLYIDPLAQQGVDVSDLRRRIDLFKEQLGYYQLILNKSFDREPVGGVVAQQIRDAYQKHFGQLYQAQKEIVRLQYQIKIWMGMKYLPGASPVAKKRLQTLAEEIDQCREEPARELLRLVHGLLMKDPRIVHVGERQSFRKITGEDKRQATVFITVIVYAVGRGQSGLGDLPALLEVPIVSAPHVLQVVDKPLLEQILRTVEEGG
jgi:hypothetical protein